MIKIYFLASLVTIAITGNKDSYTWLKQYNTSTSIESKIPVPSGYKRIEFENGSYAEWLRQLPLKPANTPVKLWNGNLKANQDAHYAVVDLDFIGDDLQQCIDALIRLRSEYLWSKGRADEVKFAYSCSPEKIPWEKWKNGWRTKIIKVKGKDMFQWVKNAAYDDSYENFRKYLYSIMMYAGTWSLSNDMKKINFTDVQCGDAYVQGASPGYGHGVLILDMAISANGKKIMLLGQSYMPAQNFHVLKNSSNPSLSPWFEVDFKDNLVTPEWNFTREHARRF